MLTQAAVHATGEAGSSATSADPPGRDGTGARGGAGSERSTSRGTRTDPSSGAAGGHRSFRECTESFGEIEEERDLGVVDDSWCEGPRDDGPGPDTLGTVSDALRCGATTQQEGMTA